MESSRLLSLKGSTFAPSAAIACGWLETTGETTWGGGGDIALILDSLCWDNLENPKSFVREVSLVLNPTCCLRPSVRLVNKGGSWASYGDPSAFGSNAISAPKNPKQATLDRMQDRNINIAPLLAPEGARKNR